MATDSTSPTSSRSFDVARWSGRIEAALRSHPVVWSAAVAAATFALFVLLLTPSFDTDDDVVMMFLADGTAYGDPLPDLIFINVALGLVMQAAYNLVPALPWYGLTLYSFHVAAFATLLYLVFSHPRLRWWIHLPALAAVSALFALYTWMDLQFTTATMLAATAAILLYVLRSYRPEAGVSAVVWAGVLLGSASILRWTAWAGIVGLSVPLLAFTITRVPWRRQILFAGVALGIMLAGIGFQSLYYASDDEWTAWHEFNDVRGDLHATDRLNEVGRDPELLNELGWARNDWAMFKTWFYMDEEVFSTEALNTIMANTAQTTEADISRSLDPLRGRKWPQARLLLMAALFVPAMVVASRRERWMLGLTVAWTVVVSGLTIYYLRFPERVAIGVLAFAAMVLLLVPGSQDPPRPRSKLIQRVSVVSLGVLVLTSLIMVVNAVAWTVPWSRTNSTQNVALQRDYRNLSTVDSDGVFVTWTTVMENQRINPLTDGISTEIDLVPIGWQERAPFHLDHIESLGIDDIHDSLAADPSVYLVTSFPQDHDLALATFLQRRYGYEGVLRPVARVGRAGNIAVFDQMVKFEVQGDRLIETSGTGAAGYPLTGGDRFRGAVEEVSAVRGGPIKGWAVDTDSGRAADLIVVLDRGVTRSLILPWEARGQLAGELGIPSDTRFGFRYNIEGPAVAEARVFAIFGDRAVELFLPTS